MKNGSYTSCSPGREDWSFELSELELDYETQTGTMRNGTLRFANTGALFQNGLRGNEAGLFGLNVNESGVFDLNGLALSIAGISGNGTITTNVAGTIGLTARNGTNADTTFSGSIDNGAGSVKTIELVRNIVMQPHACYIKVVFEQTLDATSIVVE